MFCTVSFIAAGISVTLEGSTELISLHFVIQQKEIFFIPV